MLELLSAQFVRLGAPQLIILSFLTRVGSCKNNESKSKSKSLKVNRTFPNENFLLKYFFP